MDDNDTITVGHRILFHPQLRPNKTHNNAILWTDNVPLGDTKGVLIGPSNFAAKSNTMFPDQFIHRNIWDELVATFIEAGVITPTLSRVRGGSNSIVLQNTITKYYNIFGLQYYCKVLQ